MKRLLLLFTATAVAGWLSCTTQAQWNDNFDSYADGQWLDGGADDGGWKGWFNDPAAGAQVTSAFAHSSPFSVDINGAADLIHEYDGATYGLWTYTAWQYIPSNFSGLSYFILEDRYNDDNIDLHWAVQVRFDSTLGVMESEFDAYQLPYVTDQWAEIRIEIDMDTDWHTFYYNDVPLYSKAWTAGPNNDFLGSLDIGAVDLFANGASSVYYDDMSLVFVPTPGAAVLLALGLISRRRRR